MRVTFRIIEGERDSNYTNFDGHGRHVFEFVRADGSVYRVHYHKDGKTDPPTYVGPDQVVLPGLQYSTIQHGGAPQPAGGAAQGPATVVSLPVTYDDLRNVAQLRAPIGRPEGSTALQTVLHYYHTC